PGCPLGVGLAEHGLLGLRVLVRQLDPVRRGTLSPMDPESLSRGDKYTEAEEATLRQTDTEWAPWTTATPNDKTRARVNALRHCLHQFDYPDKDDQVVFAPDPKIVRRGKDAVGD